MADAELTLTDKQLVGSLTGCGVQFNQHTFAAITGAPPASFADLEEKVVRLAPQFVRLFFSQRQGDSGAGQTPENKDSFVRAARLARATGATVNVTWQSGDLDTEQARQKSMSRFANVLEELVATHGLAGLRWVTIQNEPNTLPKKDPHTGKIPKKKVTPERLDDMYRRLHELLTDKGLREQIRFMAGDLIRVSDKPEKDNQKLWFEHMDKNLAGLLDAYSVHIYWDYFTNGLGSGTDKFEARLQEVLRFVRGLRNTRGTPIFITEFGVRGRPGPRKLPAPGIFEDGTPDGTPLAQTNIAAFQQAWFLIRSMQLGYAGTIKWDCFFGTYDTGYRKKHYVIGPPTTEGWPTYPSYHALRLFTLTTGAGWKVLEVARKPAARKKQLVAAAGPNNSLTIVGLDSRGATRNLETQTVVPYTIDIGRPNARLTLVVWNRAGGGRLAADTTVAADAAGVVHVDVPLHAVFALTTKSVTV
jgi:hypothetical protein